MRRAPSAMNMEQADGVARRKKDTKLRRFSYLAAAGTIHEHRQHAVEIARRQSRDEKTTRRVLISSDPAICQIGAPVRYTCIDEHRRKPEERGGTRDGAAA